jgi:hypothetical protein
LICSRGLPRVERVTPELLPPPKADTQNQIYHYLKTVASAVITDNSHYYSPCKAYGKKLNGINDFIAHVLEANHINENYTYHFENSQHRKIEVFKSFYGTFCWNYVRPDDEEVSEYRDE